ncbi:membrane dipeptidase [Metabacillus litoralis]|uniref:Membrane dipeptidase n=1 Tax=Metabacillus litoralis TaxID=152268 RepID=A0A5C6W4P7_9BACI|nr:dipeptidase [Metabacillus litoralis]TXC91882.1 membrane dipeptidase [Metabacillus litoralis]
MKIFDAHCDLLYKLWREPDIDVYQDERLQVSISKLKKMNNNIQCFAIFIPEDVPFINRMDIALQQITIFYEKIVKNYPEIKLIKTKSDIDQITNQEIGAVLTLEGCDAIGDQLKNLQILYQLGVRSVGLTWNFANLVADGAHEKRNGGLTNFGRSVIEYLNEKQLWTDVSHASERSFWEALEIAKYPIASHSNAYSICPHVRNLRDEQIVALLKNKGMIGVTFVPFFTTSKNNPTISDVIKHVDYICGLGGENQLGFGSDFDGIDVTIEGLHNYACYETLINELQKYYNEELVHKFMYRNFLEHINF